jgi:hypothetical protein
MTVLVSVQASRTSTADRAIDHDRRPTSLAAVVRRAFTP